MKTKTENPLVTRAKQLIKEREQHQQRLDDIANALTELEKSVAKLRKEIESHVKKA